jgi:DNA-directed RNA polymerase subunit K/omega
MGPRLPLVRALNQIARITMVKRPDGMNAFEFAVLAGLRATQLHRGCSPRVTPSEKVTVTAQHEVAQRKIVKSSETTEPWSADTVLTPFRKSVRQTTSAG